MKLPEIQTHTSPHPHCPLSKLKYVCKTQKHFLKKYLSGPQSISFDAHFIDESGAQGGPHFLSLLGDDL